MAKVGLKRIAPLIDLMKVSFERFDPVVELPQLRPSRFDQLLLLLDLVLNLAQPAGTPVLVPPVSGVASSGSATNTMNRTSLALTS